MSKLTVIIPCYNEEAVINETYRRTMSAIEVLPYEPELLFINDGSTDGTSDMLNTIADADGRVKVLHFSRNFGHQPAVSAGINYCDADMAVIMDADLQDPPELIGDIVALKESTASNVVYCVRRAREKESRFRLFVTKIAYRFINGLSEVPLPLDTGDFRLIDRQVMEQFRSLRERNKYVRGVVSWLGFRQTPFYFERKGRLAGKAKYSPKKLIRLGMTGLLYFSKKPLALATWLGIASVLVAFALVGSLSVKNFLSEGVSANGYETVIITVFFFGGIQLLTVGILGNYIGAMFDEIKGRPEYIVKEFRGFNKV